MGKVLNRHYLLCMREILLEFHNYVEMQCQT